MKISLLKLSAIFLLTSFGIQAKEPVTNTYKNPVIAANMPDPTVIKARDGYFYLYATQGKHLVPIYKSKNLTDWTFAASAFTKETKPDFEPKAGIWAPDINYIAGKYVMYYSMSVWGGEWTCGIGVATANKPEGPFTDHGKLFRSNEIGVQNSIDPFYFRHKGKNYLFWGSFRGIYYTELSGDGLQLKKDTVVRQIAGTAFEGTYIMKRGRYYYLFASVGSCCEGVKSTYKMVVGRSESLFGPYTDKAGKDMMENGYEVVIDKNEHFVGNGHNSEIVKDKAGNDWVLYHGVDMKNPRGRVLMLDKISWTKDGWPFVSNNGTPSLEAAVPVF